MLNSIALFPSWLRSLESILSLALYYNKALSIKNLGELYAKEHKFSKANALFVQAEKILQFTIYPLEFIWLQITQANTLLVQQKLSLAKNLLLNIDIIYLRKSAHFWPLGGVLTNLGYTYFKEKNYRESIEYYLEALSIWKNENNLLMIANIEDGLFYMSFFTCGPNLKSQ